MDNKKIQKREEERRNRILAGDKICKSCICSSCKTNHAIHTSDIGICMGCTRCEGKREKNIFNDCAIDRYEKIELLN